MIGEGNIWRKAWEDDSVIIIECMLALNPIQFDRLRRQFDELLEGTGKKVLILQTGLKHGDGKVRLHVEQKASRQPFQVFDQHGRELEGVRVVSVTDAVNDARVLQIEVFEIHSDGEYVPGHAHDDDD